MTSHVESVALADERIETARLVLRTPVFSDGPGIHAFVSDRSICRFSPHPVIVDLAVTQFLIVGWDESRAQGWHSYVLTLTDRRREPIGFINVGPDQELGGLLSPRAGGQGLATEALEAVIGTLGLRHAWTVIDADHHDLIHTLAKVNIKLERRLPAHRVHPQLSDLKRDCVLLQQH